MRLNEVKFCGMCVKRIDKAVGNLTLSKQVKINYEGEIITDKRVRKYWYISRRTVWNQPLCKSCLNKLTAFKSLGETVKDDFELLLDKTRLENTSFQLLGLNKNDK